jgi:nicotinamide mononucleotide transporter
VQTVLAELRLQFAALSPAEIIAVVMAIAYLVLAIRQNIWCWVCAAVSTAIYVYLFFGARLYMEAVLNAFYFGMAAYGWIVWRSGSSESESLPVSVWSPRTHAIALVAITTAAALTGFLLHRFTDAALPYLDSLTTYSAIWATFLVARKVLENWWYWLVIDTASVEIYWSRDLQLTSLLFVFYVILIPFGLFAWRRSYFEHTGTARPA